MTMGSELVGSPEPGFMYTSVSSARAVPTVMTSAASIAARPSLRSRISISVISLMAVC